MEWPLYLFKMLELNLLRCYMIGIPYMILSLKIFWGYFLTSWYDSDILSHYDKISILYHPHEIVVICKGYFIIVWYGSDISSHLDILSHFDKISHDILLRVLGAVWIFHHICNIKLPIVYVLADLKISTDLTHKDIT